MRDEVSERRALLLGAKLRGLVGDHLATSLDDEPAGFGAGVGLVRDGVAWVLLDGAADRSLGAALAWAVRRDAAALHVIAESSTGLLGRRAGGFSMPVSVWFPEGRSLLPVVAEAFAPHPEPSEEHLALTATIEAGGAEVNVEHGVVTGEVRGLEVCRVVDEATIGSLVELGEIDLSGRSDDVGVRLEVGVGANDREAFQLIHGDLPTVEALAGVVDAVRTHRSADAPQHPLNRMAPERFRRWQAAIDPGRLGFHELRPVPPPVPRPSMKEAAPAAAVGRTPDGEERLVVFSTGIDLDLVPFAVDARRAVAAWDVADVAPGAATLLVLRAADDVAITRDLADLAVDPVEIVTLG